MGVKKRGYGKNFPEGLVRDYKVFAIACEGDKREPQYFKVFAHLSRKIKVDVIDERYDEDGKEIALSSSPDGVLQRAMSYITKTGLNEQDDLWFVIDKDRWADDQIRRLNDFCEDRTN